MKVTREEVKPPFVPITIVIETEQEARMLWHRLDVDYRRLRDYCQDVGIQPESLKSEDAYYSLNVVYRPKERQ